MDHLELLQRLTVALGIGLLIGIERGWLARNEREGERALGLRTLALAGLLGGVVGAVALTQPTLGGPLLAASFLVYAAIVAVFRYREMLHDKTIGITTVMAALLVFALGVLAVIVDKSAAAAAGVAAAALLALKGVLHAWLRRLTWPELRAGLMLLAMSVILLPVLPDREYGPLGVFNPHELWLMTILIAIVSAVGYFAIKLAGDRWGVLLSAVAGGLVSSTAVTLTFARLGLQSPERAPLLRAGVLVANMTMMLRVLVVVAVFNAELLRWLAPSLMLAAIPLLAWIAWLQRRTTCDNVREGALALSSPFELAVVLKFGALLAVVMLAAKIVTHLAGAAGAIAVAAVSGFADVDALTLSMTRLAGHQLSLEAAAGAILVAVGVNSLTKAVLTATVTDVATGRRLALPMLIALAAGAVGYAVAVVLDPLAGLLAGWR
jgi:uncharacterized membrane protein (DUF4010 family)